jgi:arylsulfatase A-like enzyme
MRLIPSYLKEAGYASTAIGKWHQTVDITGAGNPTENGFDEFYGFNHGGRDYFDLSNVLTNFAPLHRGKEPIVGEKGYLTHRITDEAVNFIERKSDKPFLLYVPYNVPHTPLQAHVVDVENHHKDSTDPARKILLAMIDYLDAGVGRIIAALEKEGVYENTVIIFLTDNGGSVLATHADNTPLRGEKLQLLEGGIRVPFAISWPARIKGGQHVDTPVSSLDILPTCLAAAGVTPPDSTKLDGFNLLPLMERQAPLPERDLYWWWKTGPFAGGAAIRSGDYKMHRYPDSAGGKMTLVNLKNDPQENEDLAEKEPGRLADLREKFARWSEAADAEASAK